MSFIDWDEFEDGWVEICPRCQEAGVETNEFNEMILCTKCNGTCWITHICSE